MDDGDEEGDDTIDVQPAQGGRKDSTAARIRALIAVLKMLVQSPSIQYDITPGYVKNNAFRKEDFEDYECQVVAHLANIFRPYIPKRWMNPTTSTLQDSIEHVTLRAPFAVIANTILQATGYRDFTRRLMPRVAPSSLYGLQLGAVGMYEVFCAEAPGHFDVKDAIGVPLTSVRDVTSKPANKRAIFQQFFNMSNVDKFCRSHGLEFDMR
ncbi:hypothetical protein BGX28_001901 [Mortierella sp. GBA30]|nr:hypothetical protein BGX28_001901 [Mortierella sp. GBA30]